MRNEDEASIFGFYQIKSRAGLCIELFKDGLCFVVCGCWTSKSNLLRRPSPWTGERLLKA